MVEHQAAASTPSRSAHFDDTVPCGQTSLDLRPERAEPRAQGAVGTIADAQPDDAGRKGTAQTALGEIFVFGDDDRTVFQSILPDRAVFGFAKADVAHGDGFVTEFAQQRRECGRKLRIDHELHATTSTA